jgi:hypothetical protein
METGIVQGRGYLLTAKQAGRPSPEEVVITVEIRRGATPLSAARRAARDAFMSDLFARLLEGPASAG